MGVTSEDFGGAASSYSTTYESSAVGAPVIVGYESGFAREGSGGGYTTSKYESKSYSLGGGTSYEVSSSGLNTNEAEL